VATNESGLVREIVRAVHERFPGSFGFKVHGGPFQVVGLPDLIFCIGGWFVGLEVKFQHPGESVEGALSRTTALQWAQIGNIKRAGGVAAVVASVQEALDVITSGLETRERRGATLPEVPDREGGGGVST
jgi:hypothetical protein